jgi:hypothetical protein
MSAKGHKRTLPDYGFQLTRRLNRGNHRRCRGHCLVQSARGQAAGRFCLWEMKHAAARPRSLGTRDDEWAPALPGVPGADVDCLHQRARNRRSTCLRMPAVRARAHRSPYADQINAHSGEDQTRASAGPAAPYIRRKQRTTMSAETTTSTVPAAPPRSTRTGCGPVIAKAAQVDLEHH